jgi:glutamate dehydrogenase/leucine dehydrogenase
MADPFCMGLRLGSPPEVFADALRGELGGRAWLVRDSETGAYQASSPRLQGLADFLTANDRDARRHEAVFLEAGRGTGVLFAAVIHCTRRGQAQGGVRHWHYDSMEGFLRDGLRLSLGMTRKNALARLWWGGGKGLIARPPGDLAKDPNFRRSLYQEYGAFVSSLHGCYVTGEDAGTNPSDMAEVFRATRFASCIPPERGGAGNPSGMTAAGVVCAMEAALDVLGMGDLAGKTVVLQGTGQVGSAMMRQLLDRGVKRILASEICAERRDALLDAFSGEPVEIRISEPGDISILSEPCDVLAPCALGGVIGPKTIPHIHARIVCGAANNQLLDEQRDATALAARGIVFVPDFVANRMGIVSCANEQYGQVLDDPAVQRHLSRRWEGGIDRTTRRLLEESRGGEITPLAAALRLADALAEQTHPIWGHRAWDIIESLSRDGWVTGG